LVSERRDKSFSVKRCVMTEEEDRELLSRIDLVLVRRKAWRKRVWFKVLNSVERGLVSLTIRCVEHVRSSTLATMLRRIVERLETALKSRVEKSMVTVGWPLAQRLARLAFSWGNQTALNWTFDAKFARHLTIVHMNNSEIYRQSACGTCRQERWRDD
jgi:hypothetical protein